MPKRRSFLAVALGLAIWATVVASSQFCMPEIARVETIKLRSDDGDLTVESLQKLVKNGRVFYEVSSLAASGKKLQILMNADLTPVSLLYLDGQGRILRKADYTKNRAHIVYPEKDVDRWLDVSTPVYDQQTLFYVLRGFPFESQETVTFAVVTMDGVCAQVDVHNEGLTELPVKGGKLRAYKLVLKPAGVLSFFYTGRFYYGQKPSHFFLRFEDGGGRFAELSDYGPYLER